MDTPSDINGLIPERGCRKASESRTKARSMATQSNIKAITTGTPGGWLSGGPRSSKTVAVLRKTLAGFCEYAREQWKTGIHREAGLKHNPRLFENLRSRGFTLVELLI